MSDPLVSVVIAVVDPLQTFPTALASIINQSWTRVERILVVPSGKLTTDVKLEIDRQTEQLWVIEVPDGMHLAELLNAGIKSATGDYVAWLTSNDACDPRRIKRQVQLISGSEPPRIACSASQTLIARECPLGEQHNGVLDDLPWALLDGRLDPRMLLVPRQCLEAVGGFEPSFDHLFEYDLGLRLTARFELLVDAEPPLRRGSERVESWLRGGAGADFGRLWRSAVDSLVAQSDSEERKRMLRGLARAYAISREAGLDSAEWYVLQTAAQQAAADEVTVVRVAKGGRAKTDRGRDPQKGPAGETTFDLDGEPWTGAETDLERALQAVNSSWIVICEKDTEIHWSTLVGQVLISTSGELDACLPAVDPVVFGGPMASPVIPGTLFRTAALIPIASSLRAGEAQFWTVLGQAGRIGALPGWPATPAKTPVDMVLIDAEWYRTTYPDIAGADVDPTWHYINFGWREGRDPNPWFSTRWYVEKYPALKECERSPVEHFMREGGTSGYRPHPEFDIVWYSREYLGLDHPSPAALRHFLTLGRYLGALPIAPQDAVVPEAPAGDQDAIVPEGPAGEIVGALVDAGWYRTNYPDVAAVDPVWHYLNFGWREGRDPNPWFASRWYLQQNPELQDGDESPLEHFVREGASAGRRPHPDLDIIWYSRHHLGLDHPSPEALRHFLTIAGTTAATPGLRQDGSAADSVSTLVDAEWYRATYPEAMAPGADPASHYLNIGWREGRDPNPWFSTRWYLKQNRGFEEGESPLEHFVRKGAAAGARPHPDFDIVWYSRRYLGLDHPDPEALRHFLTVGLATSAVPVSALDGRRATTHIANHEPRDRTTLLKRLLMLTRAAKDGLRWDERDSDLWPLVLARGFPEGRTPVLVLCKGASDPAVSLARLVASALPIQEIPFYARAEGDLLRISDRLQDAEATLVLELPGQIRGLRQLAEILQVGRGVVADEELRNSTYVRWLRDAEIPVFINGPGTSAGSETRM